MRICSKIWVNLQLDGEEHQDQNGQYQADDDQCGRTHSVVLLLFDGLDEVFFPDFIRHQAAARCPADVGGILQDVSGQALLGKVSLACLGAFQMNRSDESGAAGGLDEDILGGVEHPHEVIQLGVLDGEIAGDQVGVDAGDKAGGACTGQAIGLSQAVNAEVMHIDFFVQIGGKAQQVQVCA